MSVPTLEGADRGADPTQLARRDDFDREVWNVFGAPIDAMGVAEATAAVEAAVRARRKLAFVTPNLNMLCAARRDPAARADIIAHDLSLADGAPIVWLARFLGAPVRERVAGSDLFDALRRRAAPRSRKIKTFFFGGRPGAAEAAHAALNADRGGGLQSVGWFNPGYGGMDELSRREAIDAINAAAPDFVVVALGAARGNEWIIRNAKMLEAPVIAHLGAVVDFTAGSIARAPKPLARMGLEWLWRISQEPSLWRRYWRDGLDLLSLLAINAAPLAFTSSPRSGASAEARVGVEEGVAVVRLSGDHLNGDLDAARAAFRDAVASGCDVALDFSRLGALDAAFAGQVLMLEKSIAKSGARLFSLGLSRALRRRLARTGLNIAELSDKTPAEAAHRPDSAPQRNVAAPRQSA